MTHFGIRFALVAAVKRLLPVLVLLLVSVFFFRAYAQAPVSDSLRIKIFYPVDKTVILRDFAGNAKSLATLDRILETTPPGDIRWLSITSAASPEGPLQRNLWLSRNRGESLRSYILDRRPDLSPIIQLHSVGAAWDELRELDATVPVVNDERLLRAFPRFRIILEEYLPGLRYSRVDIAPRVYAISSWDSEGFLPKVPVSISLPVFEVAHRTAATYITHRPVVALSTNLLYDFALTPNLAVELPLGRRWSLLGEYTFPWWVSADNRYAWQMLKWDVGARFWMGRRPEEWNSLTGLFLGIDLGAGYYDIEPVHKGYQGEFQTAGLEIGYGWKLSDHLRLDLSAAAGWMGTHYRYYMGNEGDTKLIYQHSGRIPYYWGPTKLAFSFKYVFTREVRRNAR